MLLKVCIIRLDHIFSEKPSSTFWQVRSCQKYDKDFFVAFSENPKFKKYYCSSWRNNKFVPWFVRSIRYVNFTRLFVTFVTSIKFHRPRGTLIRPIRLELSSQVSNQMCVHSAALYDKVLGQHYGHVFVKYLLFMFSCKMNCKAYFYSW